MPEPHTILNARAAGSHRTIQEHWERTLKPERRRFLPRTHGLRPVPGTIVAAAAETRAAGRVGLEAIPELPTAPAATAPTTLKTAAATSPSSLRLWEEQAPTAAVATRGQVFVMTGSVLHSAWHNPASTSRKSVIISWNDVGVPGGFEASRVDTMRELYPALREALPPERRHIAPTRCAHFVSSYEDRWEETFVDLAPEEQRAKWAAAAAPGPSKL
eukprot:SAG22_NODE_2845_length_2161_cov_3.238603_1_plen_216_part_00